MTQWAGLVSELEKDWEATLVHRKTWRATLKGLRENGCRTLLDAGCGVGLDAKFLTEECGFAYWGVDFTSEMLERAAERNPGLDFRQADLTRHIPAGDGEFDLVASHDVLVHVPDWRAALDEMWRVTGKYLAVRLCYVTDAVGTMRPMDVDRGVINQWHNPHAFQDALCRLVPPPKMPQIVAVGAEEKAAGSSASDWQIFIAGKERFR